MEFDLIAQTGRNAKAITGISVQSGDHVVKAAVRMALVREDSSAEPWGAVSINEVPDTDGQLKPPIGRSGF